MATLTLSMNGSFDGFLEDGEGDDNETTAGWTASDVAEHNREQRLHGNPRYSNSQAPRALVAPGSDMDPGWTASDVAEYNREQRLHGDHRYAVEPRLLSFEEAEGRR